MTQPGVRHYFAYGSNMNPARVAERGLLVRAAQAGALQGFRLVFNKMSRDHVGVGHANIEFDPAGRVEGVLYELVDGDEILKMDPFERAPWNYGREVVPVQQGQRMTWAWTYFANPAVMTADLRPPRAYMAHLLAGAEYLSDGYVQALQGYPLHD
ncbi:MAG: gamma-glutamylcyclotransferase family protein [bacterium]